MLSKVDLEEMEARHSEDLSSKRLNQVVAVKLPTSLASQHVTHYNLSPEVREMAKKIDALKDSHVFQILWEQRAELLSSPEEELDDKSLQLTDVYEDLYLPCYKIFTELYYDLKSGKITFAIINDIFKDFIGKYEDLDSDFQVMCLVNPSAQKDWIPERIQQIREYHSLHLAVNSAKVIQQVKENFELTGDFSVLHTLLNFVSFC